VGVLLIKLVDDLFEKATQSSSPVQILIDDGLSVRIVETVPTSEEVLHASHIVSFVGV
jgi:hypothetical protein